MVHLHRPTGLANPGRPEGAKWNSFFLNIDIDGLDGILAHEVQVHLSPQLQLRTGRLAFVHGVKVKCASVVVSDHQVSSFGLQDRVMRTVCRPLSLLRFGNARLGVGKGRLVSFHYHQPRQQGSNQKDPTVNRLRGRCMPGRFTMPRKATCGLRRKGFRPLYQTDWYLPITAPLRESADKWRSSPWAQCACLPAADGTAIPGARATPPCTQAQLD